MRYSGLMLLIWHAWRKRICITIQTNMIYGDVDRGAHLIYVPNKTTYNSLLKPRGPWITLLTWEKVIIEKQSKATIIPTNVDSESKKYISRFENWMFLFVKTKLNLLLPRMLCAKFGWLIVHVVLGNKINFNFRQCIFAISLLTPIGKGHGS